MPSLWPSFPTVGTEDMAVKPMSSYPLGQSHWLLGRQRETGLGCILPGAPRKPASVNPSDDWLKCRLQLWWGPQRSPPPFKTQQLPPQPNVFQQERAPLPGRSPHPSGRLGLIPILITESLTVYPPSMRNSHSASGHSKL